MPGAQILTERDLRRALTHCQSRRHTQRDQTIIQVSYYAGLRACEIASLTVGDVYDETGNVRAQVALTASQTKGKRSRVIYISQKLAKLLKDYRASIAGRTDDKPLFMTQMRTAFSANTMCQLFLEIYGAVGLKGCSSHSGRKSFITNLADKGVAVHLLAALAGHRSIQTTQRYITVNDALLARAVELV